MIVLASLEVQAAAAEGEAAAVESSTVAARTATTPPPKPANLYSLLTPDALKKEIAQRNREPGDLAARLERTSRGLVGAPYVLSPLGEGEGEDPDPRLRFDAFDCTTLVETALALARCDDPSELLGLLDRIRYRGEPSFVHRRHLVEAEWVPDLIHEGFLRDITRQIGGAHTKRTTLNLSKENWKARRIAKTLVLPESELPFGKYDLDYVPFTEVSKLKVPPGTVINVVRVAVNWSPTLITHQGLVLRSPVDGSLIVRHASPLARRVIDERLDHFLERYIHPKVDKGWPAVGLSFFAVSAE